MGLAGGHGEQPTAVVQVRGSQRSRAVMGAEGRDGLRRMSQMRCVLNAGERGKSPETQDRRPSPLKPPNPETQNSLPSFAGLPRVSCYTTWSL